jgi:hypothetical protein
MNFIYEWWIREFRHNRTNYLNQGGWVYKAADQSLNKYSTEMYALQ